LSLVMMISRSYGHAHMRLCVVIPTSAGLLGQIEGEGVIGGHTGLEPLTSCMSKRRGLRIVALSVAPPRNGPCYDGHGNVPGDRCGRARDFYDSSGLASGCLEPC